MEIKDQKPNFWQVLVSVLGAFIGVQSSKVRERDFTAGQPWWVYLLVGIIILIIIILGLIGFTKLLMIYLKP